jgi:hypothetical protein
MSAESTRISAGLAADSRRNWILVILAVVLLIIWGRLIFGGARFGEAALLPAAQSSGGDLQNVSRGERRGSGLSLAQWAQEPIKQTPRNFFRVPFDSYQPDPNHPPQSLQKSDEGKSSADGTDQNKERQKLVESLREQAADLTLESTMPGPHPQAWINGLVVGLGDPIGTTGFTVAKIETRRIFIERDHVQIVLSMK